MYLTLHATAAQRRRSSRQLIVLYDADCGFCLAVLSWLRAHDRDGRLRCVPLQEAPTSARPIIRELAGRRDLRAEIHVVDERAGTVTWGARAMLDVLAVLPRWHWLARLGRPRPALAVADAAYRLVARHRRRLGRLVGVSGRATCEVLPRPNP
ncbi:MAG: thiol-disulfide oxidoreductase DCC family protein [Candidatus Limnocylindrales bacterium]